MTRAILHCDLDAFYASVEQRDHPEYRGKPVIVGGDGPNERGVVMAASYEARAFGVRSAMPLAIAGRLCPEGIYVSGNFDRYLEASDAVMAIFDEKTPLVEPISLDEAFLDVTATEHLFGGAVAIAKEIKRAVREGCGLVVSVGVATNKLCAKVGSDLRKPDGLVIVPEGGEAAFLAPLPMERLWASGHAPAKCSRVGASERSGSSPRSTARSSKLAWANTEPTSGSARTGSTTARYKASTSRSRWATRTRSTRTRSIPRRSNPRSCVSPKASAGAFVVTRCAVGRSP